MVELTDQGKKIWLLKVKPTFDSLLSGTCPFPKVQSCFNQNTRLIADLYLQKVKLVLCGVTRGVVEGQAVMFTCTLENGQPQIWIHLSELQKVFVELKASSPQVPDVHLAKMERATIIHGIMHETDHLALGMPGPSPTIEDAIEKEIVVNARTCENTLAPLCEEYGQPLMLGDVERYRAWVQCGRNAQSIQWRNFITDLYREGIS